MYNTPEEVDSCIESLRRLITLRLEKHASKASPSDLPSNTTGDSTGDATAGGEPPEGSTVLTFGSATGESPDDAAETLAEEFLMFDDRESKTELLMELGDELPREFEQLKILTTAVPGCMSEVYLVGRPCPKDPEKFEFAADSNAEVVRGLIAILMKLFSGQPADAILEFDIESFFRKIGFDQFVSTQRRSGLDGMIQRIRFLAEQIVQRAQSN
jgi:cysteine desulfurase/selenocysteine lyase